MSSELTLEQRAMRHSNISWEERKKRSLAISDITKAGFDALMAR